jgi:hypothetical protein
LADVLQQFEDDEGVCLLIISIELRFLVRVAFELLPDFVHYLLQKQNKSKCVQTKVCRELCCFVDVSNTSAPSTSPGGSNTANVSSSMSNLVIEDEQPERRTGKEEEEVCCLPANLM